MIPWLIRGRDGQYYDRRILPDQTERVEREVQAWTQPAPSRPSVTVSRLKMAGYFAATALAGLGVLIGLLIVAGLASVFWVIRKIRRAGKEQ